MSAMLYELTASAARVCTPLPIAAAAPHRWLGLLDHWQTLLGAAIGGGLGVVGAWVVAVSSRNREQRIAAGMVLPDLHQLASAGGALEYSLSRRRAGEDPERAGRAVARLDTRRPAPFALHTSVIGQLSDVDARLYSHLFQCEMVHRNFEDGIATRQNVGSLNLHPTDAALYRDWQLAVEHAELTAYYLDRLVFSRRPRWLHRVRMKLWPNDLDRRSSYLLAKGEPLCTSKSLEPADSAAAQR